MDFSSISTNAAVKQRARELSSCASRVYPESVGGTSIADLEWIAGGPKGGDRSVYIRLSQDGSKGRLGEGYLPDRFLGHCGAVISRLAPSEPICWSIPQSLIDFIGTNGFRLPYVVLAEGLAKADVFAGQQRTFNHFGIGQHSFLITPWRR
ncbi:MAG TPA: hypothetical protein VGG79_23310 [Roseiarcus sp.]|jgi:hypothetical protein